MLITHIACLGSSQFCNLPMELNGIGLYPLDVEYIELQRPLDVGAEKNYCETHLAAGNPKRVQIRLSSPFSHTAA